MQLLKTSIYGASAMGLTAAALLIGGGFMLECPRMMNNGADVAAIGLSLLAIPTFMAVLRAHTVAPAR